MGEGGNQMPTWQFLETLILLQSRKALAAGGPEIDISLDRNTVFQVKFFQNKYTRSGRSRRIRELRNRLAHGSSGDQLALWEDQQEIRGDLNIAMLAYFVEERPDVLVAVLKDIVKTSAFNDLSEADRTKIELLLQALQFHGGVGKGKSDASMHDAGGEAGEGDKKHGEVVNDDGE